MTSPTSPSSKTDGHAQGENEMTKCLLSQYRFCAAGIGLGTAYALRYKKGVIPMVAAGAIGTSADMVYGYLVECAQYRDSWSSSSSSSGDESSSSSSSSSNTKST